jgi:hypothetical protein
LKSLRHKKVLGLSIGDRSMLVAEVAAAGAGDRPDVRHLAELSYPAGVSLDQPVELGKMLFLLLREKRITAQAAVIGLPAKWMVASPKELPEAAASADPATKASILRLQAEAEFSTELKDLVFDFVDAGGRAPAGETQTVLLMATPRRYIDAAVAMCRAAKLTPIAVTPSAVALGEATSRALPNASDALVMSVGAGGAELTAQQDASPNLIRHLRAPSSQALFVSELRRAFSTIASKANRRDLVLWDGSGLDGAELARQAGINVRDGDLPALGVNASGMSQNGAGRAYGPAVSLGLAGLRGERPAIDFLHSRLAPPKTRRVPRWAYLAGATAIVLIGGAIFAYSDLQKQEAEVARMRSRLDGMKNELGVAEAFVSRVSFAQAWHAGEPRYLACVRDLTNAIPDDGATFATSLVIREAVRSAAGGATASSPSNPKKSEVHVLAGLLYGKTTDQQHVQIVLDRMKQNPAFTAVKLGGTQDAGRGQQVSFSITFDYRATRSSSP